MLLDCKERLDPFVEMIDLLEPRFKLDWLSSQEQEDQALFPDKEMLEETGGQGFSTG